MSNLQKMYDARVKAAGDEGRFEAVVSVFGNVDLQGDRVVKGAFRKSIEEWVRSGDPIPVIWSHDWGNPHSIIGGVDARNVSETEKGLLIRDAWLDMENPVAAQVHNLMKQRLVREFSFAYDVVREKKAGDSANDLLQLDIIEVGPTLKGANPLTELVGVKSALGGALGQISSDELKAMVDGAFGPTAEHKAFEALLRAKNIYLLAEIAGRAPTPAERAEVERIVGEVMVLEGNTKAESRLREELDRRSKQIRTEELHRRYAMESEYDRLAKRAARLRGEEPRRESARTFDSDEDFARYLKSAGFDDEHVRVALGGESDQERADRQRAERRAKALDDYKKANAAITAGGLIPGIDADRERDEEQHARAVRESEERDAARKAEGDQLDELHEARRRAAPRQFGGES